MNTYLVVTRPFLDYVRGDIIVDAAKIIAIMSTEYKKFTTRISPRTVLKG